MFVCKSIYFMVILKSLGANTNLNVSTQTYERSKMNQYKDTEAISPQECQPLYLQSNI